MKISVLIIAHNEEKYIERCIKSLINQDQKPEEIVLISHNCTDKTIEIAQKYDAVTVIPFAGESGVTHARIYGMKKVCGDIVCCIDGDTFATKNWVSSMVTKLKEGAVLVGSPVFYYGPILPFLNSIYHFYFRFLFKKTKFYPYGPSMAFFKKDYEKIGGWEPFIEIRSSLDLIRWPDDYYIGLMFAKIGKVVCCYKSFVFAKTKEKNTIEVLKRSKLEMRAGKKLFTYLRDKS